MVRLSKGHHLLKFLTEKKSIIDPINEKLVKVCRVRAARLVSFY